MQTRYRMVDNLDCYDWPKFLHDIEKGKEDGFFLADKICV